MTAAALTGNLVGWTGDKAALRGGRGGVLGDRTLDHGEGNRD